MHSTLVALVMATVVPAPPNYSDVETLTLAHDLMNLPNMKASHFGVRRDDKVLNKVRELAWKEGLIFSWEWTLSQPDDVCEYVQKAKVDAVGLGPVLSEDEQDRVRHEWDLYSRVKTHLGERAELEPDRAQRLNEYIEFLNERALPYKQVRDAGYRKMDKRKAATEFRKADPGPIVPDNYFRSMDR